MKFLGDTDITGTVSIGKEGEETSEILLYINDLFDSLNGGGNHKRGFWNLGSKLLGAVRKNSIHLPFWRDAAKSIGNMYFQTEGSMEHFVPPSLKNFKLTVEGFIDLSHVLFDKKSLYFWARAFNQDPLENYFCQIRHRGRQANPTCIQFKDSYKSLLLKGIISSHSTAANCEETFDTSLIQLKNLLEEPRVTTSQRNFQLAENFYIDEKISSMSNGSLERPVQKAAMGYVAGFVAKKTLDKFTCELCKIHILKTDNSDDSDYARHTKAKEYNKQKISLIYVNDLFVRCIYKIFNISKLILSNFNISKNPRKVIFHYTQRYVHFSFVCAHKDEVITFISNFVINFSILHFCKYVNRLLIGKETCMEQKNSIYKQAIDIYNKKIKFRK